MTPFHHQTTMKAVLMLRTIKLAIAVIRKVDDCPHFMLGWSRNRTESTGEGFRKTVVYNLNGSQLYG